VAGSRGTVIAASGLGKSKTVLQDIALVALMLDARMDFGLWVLPDWLSYHNIGTLVMYVAVFYTMYSGYDYVAKFVASESDRRGAPPAA
jgi:CDP-diacylglycerol--glycerol-3-phosphate 3-phosphatidyltransferase